MLAQKRVIGEEWFSATVELSDITAANFGQTLNHVANVDQKKNHVANFEQLLYATPIYSYKNWVTI